VLLNYLPLLLIAIAFVPIASYAQTDFGAYDDPYFGITIQRPAGWYIEGDNPWNHAHISPWHLPLIPIKELQPTAVDILLEGKKTLIASIEPADESGSCMQLSVERCLLARRLWTAILITRLQGCKRTTRICRSRKKLDDARREPGRPARHHDWQRRVQDNIGHFALWQPGVHFAVRRRG
jgi:hypothetical protein